MNRRHQTHGSSEPRKAWQIFKRVTVITWRVLWFILSKVVPLFIKLCMKLVGFELCLAGFACLMIFNPTEALRTLWYGIEAFTDLACELDERIERKYFN